MQINARDYAILALLLAGCSTGGGGSTSTSGGPNPNPNPNPNPGPVVVLPRLQLRLEVVSGRAIDRVISSYRLSLLDSGGFAVAGPRVFPKDVSFPEQLVDWTDLPPGTFTFQLELLDSAGRLRGTYQQTVQLNLNEQVVVSNPPWEDAALPAADPAPHPPGLQPVVREVAIGTTAQDCAFDSARQRLYVSRGNQVDSYDPSTRQFSPLINLATAVGRMDLSADGSRLLITLPSANSLGVIDLTTSPPTSTSVSLPNGPPGTGSRRPFDVVGLSNGKALVSCGLSGDSTTLLREVNLATLTPTVRTDVNISYQVLLAVSGDRNQVIMNSVDVSPANVRTYSVLTDTFSPNRRISNSTAEFVAADASGQELMGGDFLFDAAAQRTGRLDGLGLGAVFAPKGRAFRMRRVSSDHELEILDVRRRLVLQTLPLARRLTGGMAISDSGRRIFGVADTFLLDIDLGENLPPVVEPLAETLVPIGQSARFRVHAFDPDGDAIQWVVGRLPNGADFNPTTQSLRFAPSGGAANTSNTAVLYASDGKASTRLEVSLKIAAPDSAFTLVPTGDNIARLALDRKQSRVYASNSALNRVEAFALQGCDQFLSLDTGQAPAGIDLTPDGNRLLVCNSRTNFVQFWNTSTGSLEWEMFLNQAVQSDIAPLSTAISRQSKALVGYSSKAAAVTEVDLATQNAVDRYDYGSLPTLQELDASWDRSRIGILQEGTSSASLVEYLDGTMRKVFGGKPYPLGVAANPDGSLWLVGQAATFYDSSGNPIRSRSNLPQSNRHFAFVDSRRAVIQESEFRVQLFSADTDDAPVLATLPAPLVGPLVYDVEKKTLVVALTGRLAFVKLELPPP